MKNTLTEITRLTSLVNELTTSTEEDFAILYRGKKTDRVAVLWMYEENLNKLEQTKNQLARLENSLEIVKAV